MTMLDFYKLSLIESLDLRDKVLAEGTKIGNIYNKERYNYNELIEYNGDVFQVDSYLGIWDINNTRKEV